MAYNYSGNLTVSNTTTTHNLVVTNGISDNQLKWNSALAGDITPIDAAASGAHSANRLAFAPAAGITIEYSTNSGSSWTTYNTTDGAKIQFMSGIDSDNSYYYLGNKTSAASTVTDQLRITLTAASLNVYTAAKKLLIYYATRGAAGSKVKVERQSFAGAWSVQDTYSIGGDAGWNSIPLGFAFGSYNTSTSQVNIKAIRLTFSTTGVSRGPGARIQGIALFGTTCWTTPSFMAKNDHLYTWDYAQHMKVPNGIYPNTSLSSDFGSTSHVWNTGYIQTLNITDKCNATNGFFQTSDIRKKNIMEELDLNKCYEMLDKCQEVLYTLKDDDKEQIGMIAQEVEEFFPEIISTDKDGYKSIDYSKLTVICLRIIKDLYKRVEKLENKQ